MPMDWIRAVSINPLILSSRHLTAANPYRPLNYLSYNIRDGRHF